MSRKVNWFRVPTPITPMLLIEGRWHQQDEMGGLVGTDSTGVEYILAVPSPVWFHGDVKPTVLHSSNDVGGADVRFRFSFPKDHEKTAKEIAGRVKAVMLADGAVNVTLDPKPEPEIRSRIPELTTATTLEEKATLYRDSTEAKVEESEQKILDSYLQEIQDELAAEGVSFGVQSRAVPTLKRIRGKGWHCFPNDFDIPLAQLGELVAIVGPNESGKTLLGSLMGPGLFYGDTPNRGTLDDLSRARDAFIEGIFDMDGKEYRLVQTSNAMIKTNKGSVSLSIGNAPVLQKAGREEYKAWTKKTLLPWPQYLTLLFHSGTEDDGGRKISIIDMKDKDRTDLMLKVLGIEYYEAIAQRARDKAKDVSAQLATTNARLSELGQDDMDGLRKTARDSKRLLDDEQGRLIFAERELLELRAVAAEREKRAIERKNLLTQQTELQGRESSLRAKLADIDERLANNQAILADADAIRQAHIDLDCARQQLDNCQEMDRGLKTTAMKLGNLNDLAERDRTARLTTKTRLIGELAQLGEIIAERESVQATIDSIPEFEAAVKECIADRDGALKDYEELQAQTISGKDDRISALCGGYRSQLEAGEIATADGSILEVPYLLDIAQASLAADERAAKDADDHPALLRQAKAAWQQREARAKEAEAQLASLNRHAERMTAVETAETRKTVAMAEAEANEHEIREIEAMIATRNEELATLAKEIQVNDETAARVSTEIETLTPLAGKLPVLESAEVRITELTAQRKDIQHDLDGVIDTLGRLTIPDAEEPINIAPHVQAVETCQRAIRQCNQALAVAEQAVKGAEVRETRRVELNESVSAFAQSLDFWNRIAREWGVDGLQKEEVANAGPQLTDMVNELLRAGGDDRHTVDIRTERPHSREKRMIPCFDIQVFDSVEQQWKPAERLSGYGLTVVGKGLSMGLVKLGCQRAGIKSPTIFFDELTGQAQPENAVKIIGMVRHFASQLNAQVLFVSQSPDIQDMADNRIMVGNGSVMVA